MICVLGGGGGIRTRVAVKLLPVLSRSEWAALAPLRFIL